jgi:hypothetical protein
MRPVMISACVLAVTIVITARTHASTAASGRDPQLPQKFTNLQSLPKDISQQDLVGIMRSFAIGLGTRCEHCHVGQGNDLSKFDFASDEKPEKATARKMMALLNAVNGDYLKGIGDPSKPLKVSCYTCHRGALKPLVAPPGGGVAP